MHVRRTAILAVVAVTVIAALTAGGVAVARGGKSCKPDHGRDGHNHKARNGKHSKPQHKPGRGRDGFTLAVIPDTQNYTDYEHQTAHGFPIDAHTILDDQLQFIADNARGAGGDIAFATMVGDSWEHQSLEIDPESIAKGYSAISNPYLAAMLAPTPYTRSVEMPLARAAYERHLAGALPFSVVPGNHDYDAMYSDSRWPPASDPSQIDPVTYAGVGMLHMGGLENFREAFGSQTSFFRGEPWYVSSFDGGTSSAQLFRGGDYVFLHIGLEMAAPDDALAWASKVIRKYRGLPTIVTTHDYIDTRAQRQANPVIDPKATDPEHNNAQDLWDKFIAKNDQIFLVLSGHFHGEANRVDDNRYGHPVYQILSDYQDRTHVSTEVGTATPTWLGDGWMRLMEFDFAGKTPAIKVRTYSTYYDSFSTDLAEYASWYKASEAPALSDAEFLAKGDFTIKLTGFKQRFGSGAPASLRHVCAAR